MGFWQFVKLGLGLLSTDYTNEFEYNTDQICIDHGAGFQLLAWSQNTQQYFSKEVLEQYFGAEAARTERYMFPETIERKMKENPLHYEQ
jgi:hypothetical protein